MTNKYAPFKEIGALQLRQLLRERAGRGQDSSGSGAGPAAQGPHGDVGQLAAAILDGFNEVEPHEDIPTGFQRLSDAGYQVRLSNSQVLDSSAGPQVPNAPLLPKAQEFSFMRQAAEFPLCKHHA